MMANEEAITITSNHEHEQEQPVYHVFLSFRGSDTRHSFTENLFNALSHESFKTFYDADSLKKDDLLEASILKAIEGSKIAIVVLSENYVDSSFCLDELVEIVERWQRINLLVVPIFYDVDASDVRHLRGKLGEIFYRFQKRFEKERFQKWMSALNQVADMIGFLFRKGNTSEHKFIQDITKYVYRILPRYDVFLSFSEQDTRYSFSGHLYNALNEEGFQTSICKEDQTSQSLLKVIEKSRLSIIVLSENYAYSSSCLDELVTILDLMKKNNQLLVWPIFYKVEPTIIRYQKDSYEKAMNKHEIEYGKDSETVKAWRSALFEVASLNGRHLKDGYDYEYQFVEKIVKAAIKI